MILALLFAASTPSVIDAENAFARDAQRLGQWTAFARYADTDAVMFTPQAVWAHDFLKGRKNPPASVRCGAIAGRNSRRASHHWSCRALRPVIDATSRDE